MKQVGEAMKIFAENRYAQTDSLEEVALESVEPYSWILFVANWVVEIAENLNYKPFNYVELSTTLRIWYQQFTTTISSLTSLSKKRLRYYIK